MAQVTLRPKGQVTIPASILAQWNARPDDVLDVQLANGVVMFTPVSRLQTPPDLMAFAGLGKGLWGDTPEQVEAGIQSLRDSWVR
jgi:antitoxin component of MazEF toxin-antitoxin module